MVERRYGRRHGCDPAILAAGRGAHLHANWLCRSLDFLASCSIENFLLNASLFSARLLFSLWLFARSTIESKFWSSDVPLERFFFSAFSLEDRGSFHFLSYHVMICGRLKRWQLAVGSGDQKEVRRYLSILSRLQRYYYCTQADIRDTPQL